jgi:hypothetical protein
MREVQRCLAKRPLPAPFACHSEQWESPTISRPELGPITRVPKLHAIMFPCESSLVSRPLADM